MKQASSFLVCSFSVFLWFCALCTFSGACKWASQPLWAHCHNTVVIVGLLSCFFHLFITRKVNTNVLMSKKKIFPSKDYCHGWETGSCSWLPNELIALKLFATDHYKRLEINTWSFLSYLSGSRQDGEENIKNNQINYLKALRADRKAERIKSVWEHFIQFVCLSVFVASVRLLMQLAFPKPCQKRHMSVFA